MKDPLLGSAAIFFSFPGLDAAPVHQGPGLSRGRTLPGLDGFFPPRTRCSTRTSRTRIIQRKDLFFLPQDSMQHPYITDPDYPQEEPSQDSMAFSLPRTRCSTRTSRTRTIPRKNPPVPAWTGVGTRLSRRNPSSKNWSTRRPRRFTRG